MRHIQDISGMPMPPLPTAFCFDLDGTLTRAEMLPALAAHLGLSDEIATLTRQTIAGEIDFETSFRRRCQMLGTATPQIVRAVVEGMPLEPALVAFIQARPAQCFIVTGNLDLWIGSLAKRIGGGLYSSSAQVRDGRVEVDTVLDKGAALGQIRATGRFGRIVAIGDGANDVPMFKAADVAIAFGAAHPPAPAAREAADHVITDVAQLCRMLTAL
jgi:phosphoserine phosphatase